jgi:hypothetical protein
MQIEETVLRPQLQLKANKIYKLSVEWVAMTHAAVARLYLE